MPSNPLKGIIQDMAAQLKTRPFDRDLVIKRQEEARKLRNELSDIEPGQPEQFNSEV